MFLVEYYQWKVVYVIISRPFALCFSCYTNLIEWEVADGKNSSMQMSPLCSGLVSLFQQFSMDPEDFLFPFPIYIRINIMGDLGKKTNKK